MQNDDGIPAINKLLQSIAGNCKGTSIYNLYVDSSLHIDEELSTTQFTEKFSTDKGDLTTKESTQVFEAMNMGRTTVSVYHYLSCLESYSIQPL